MPVLAQLTCTWPEAHHQQQRQQRSIYPSAFHILRCELLLCACESSSLSCISFLCERRDAFHSLPFRWFSSHSAVKCTRKPLQTQRRLLADCGASMVFSSSNQIGCLSHHMGCTVNVKDPFIFYFLPLRLFLKAKLPARVVMNAYLDGSAVCLPQTYSTGKMPTFTRIRRDLVQGNGI